MKKGILNLAMGVVLLLSLFALKLLVDFSDRDVENVDTEAIEKTNDSRIEETE